ncbi:hypothetical protein N325_08510, partial [Colius striatus]
SLQTLELFTVVWALEMWWCKPLNIVTDSFYVAGIAQRIEDARIKDVRNRCLFDLLRAMQAAIRQRTSPYCVIHIRSHKYDIGLGAGNARADKLVALEVPVNKFNQTREAHATFHQNARGLRRSFDLSIEDTRAIVRACPQCSHYGPGLGLGVNPRVLGPLELWQMDVTHISEFGRLKYVHVTVDTFIKYIWATAQAGERVTHVIRHATACFAVMGVPDTIKTDNGPAYVSQRVSKFFQTWGVKHIIGVPHSPTGQAIVERAHQVLKSYLSK